VRLPGRTGRTALAGLLLLAVGTLGCRGEKGREGEDSMRAILDAHPHLRAVAREAPRYRLQAVLGRIEVGPEGRATLVQDGFRLGAEYFYPASSVKLFAAVAALERLGELREETGLPLDVDTPLLYHPLFDGETLAEADPSNLAGGRITVRHEIRKLFLVSDNEAFNRLYELTGQDRLAASLARAGLPAARIVHRLSEARSPEENRHFPRIDFVGDGFVYTLPERISEPLPELPPIPGLAVGTAFLTDLRRVDTAMDFRGKNRISLADLQRGLCQVVRPDVDRGGPGDPGGGRPGFRLSDDDRALLLEAMSQLPRESANPVYDPAEFPDSYVKFLLPGLAAVIPPERLRIANKIGQAYGFTTENAWVVDAGTGRGFFLAATLYTNEDGVLNDDAYEYESVAVPFFTALGEVAARRLLAGEPESR